MFSQLGAAYVSATTGAVATALGLNSLAKVRFFSSVSKLVLLCVCTDMSGEMIHQLGRVKS